MSYLEEQVEIANPQQPHCATVLLLDTSYSMSGDKIRQLNEGLQAFVDEVREDELARKRVDLAVVSFGSQVGVVQDFSSVEELALPMPESILGGRGDVAWAAVMTVVAILLLTVGGFTLEVSADGMQLNTSSGGVEANDWHGPIPNHQ